MIGNNNNNCITSLLVLVTSTICDAFQPTPTLRQQQQQGSLLWRFQLGGQFQNRHVSQPQRPPPMIPSGPPRSTVMTMTPWEANHLVTPNHRRRQGRYMIGDYYLMELSNTRGGGSSGDATFTTTASRASFRQTSSSSSSELYCSAIRPDAYIATDDDDDDGPKIIKSATTTTPTWKKKLLQFSTLASLLCVIDCTILPILTVILPLLGMVSAVPTMVHHAVHHYGHLLTIYFVLPTGTLATTINYCYNHGKKWITAIGWVGLLLILAANSGSGGCGAAVVAEHLSSHAHHHHHLANTSFTNWDGMIHFLSSIRNTIQHGMYHRITNLSGCAFLILSNYLSHQYHQKDHRRIHGKDCCTPLL